MKLVPALCFCLFASGAPAFEIDELFDRLDAALTVAAFHDNFRARLSGTIDLEIYNFEQPAPGLIDSSIDNLITSHRAVAAAESTNSVVIGRLPVHVRVSTAD